VVTQIFFQIEREGEVDRQPYGVGCQEGPERFKLMQHKVLATYYPTFVMLSECDDDILLVPDENGFVGVMR
jgi:hypothetical protein